MSIWLGTEIAFQEAGTDSIKISLGLYRMSTKPEGAWCGWISVCKDTAMGEGARKWCESASSRVLLAIRKILVFFQSKIRATGRF